MTNEKSKPTPAPAPTPASPASPSDPDAATLDTPSDVPYQTALNSKRTTHPERIGPYAIQRVLGTGGMATVYAALQKAPRRTVAIKVLKGGAASPQILHRFKREIEILGRLHHPFIAQVYDAGTYNDGGGDVPYFVMEYVPRPKTIIEYAVFRKLDLHAKLRLFVKVCAAVEHGHRHKIIHRDLKPGNILVDESGHPKVIDFGVARALEVDPVQAVHTEAGHLLGTVKYMSPEQVAANPRDLTPASDVYALGVVLFELLTGQFPYDLKGVSIYEAARIVREQPPRKPHEINPQITGTLEQILLEALGKDPQQRCAHAGRLGRKVSRWLDQQPVERSVSHQDIKALKTKTRSPIGRIFSVVIFLALIVAALIYVAIQKPWITTESKQVKETTTADVPVISVKETADDFVSPSREPPEPFLLHTHRGRITDLAYGPSNNLLATASDDGTTKLWNLNRKRVRSTFGQFDAAVDSIVFSNDGARLLIGDTSGYLEMFDTDTGRRMTRIEQNCDSVACATVNTDGSIVVVGCDDLTLRRMGIEDQSERLLRGTTGAFSAAAFSTNGKSLAGGTEGGSIYVFNDSDGKLHQVYEGLNDLVLAVQFSSDGQYLVAVDQSGVMKQWSLNTGSVEHDLSWNLTNDDIVDVSFDAEGNWLALATIREVMVVELHTNIRAAEGITIEHEITAIALSPDARQVAIGDPNGEVQFVPIYIDDVPRYGLEEK